MKKKTSEKHRRNIGDRGENRPQLDILVSRNPDSGNMETGIPERKPPLIGLINTHKESNECQAQSRFAGHKQALHL